MFYSGFRVGPYRLARFDSSSCEDDGGGGCEDDGCCDGRHC